MRVIAQVLDTQRCQLANATANLGQGYFCRKTAEERTPAEARRIRIADGDNVQRRAAWKAENPAGSRIGGGYEESGGTSISS